MSKSISSALLSDIQQNVTTLATCVEIVRKDGRTFRMTTHDTDLLVDTRTFRHDMAFTLAASASSTQLAVDNTQLTLFCDEVNYLLADFKSALFEYAAVTIFQVNYNDTTRGILTMRTGWFGQIDFSENRIVRVTITGLLKVLDLEVGRVYQAACDADLGDSRCKIAIQQNQIRSELNPYHVGDWFYYYDPAHMTALTVINPGFETDGAIGSGTPITGWTKTPGAQFQVRGDSGGTGSFSPLVGSFMLFGATLVTAPFESGLYQDIAVATQIGSTTGIDAGKISIALFAAIVSTGDLANVWRIKVEMMDTNGVILDTQDTRYVQLDALAVWREKACVTPLLPGTRTVRIRLYSLTGALGTGIANACDRIRMYYWDHTAGTPYSGVIHKVTRIGAFGVDATVYMDNSSFEVNGNVANANGPTITSWTTGAGNWWQINTTAYSGALTPQDGTHFLFGGDDSSGATKLYAITQTKSLTAVPGAGGFSRLPSSSAVQGQGVDLGRLLLGKYGGTLNLWVGYGDTTSKATVILDWLDVSNANVGSITVVNDVVGSVGWQAVVSPLFAVPGAATQVKITLKARSPAGSGNAKVAFDNIRLVLYDVERPTLNDPIAAFGSASTVINTTIGTITSDNGLLLRAFGALTAYDIVASVTDPRKTFVGTNIAGADGTFETGPIRWLSGNNAGLRNTIRKWVSGTKSVKTYFVSPHAIQVGDRYFYSQACQHRFVEDCMLRFTNTSNFRGFPFTPGAVLDRALSNVPPPAAAVYQTLPASGPAAGGTLVVLKGTQMNTITAVKFGGTPATVFTIIDAQTVQCTAPAHAVGIVTVTITGVSPRSSFTIAAGNFTYV